MIKTGDRVIVDSVNLRLTGLVVAFVGINSELTQAVVSLDDECCFWDEKHLIYTTMILVHLENLSHF